MREMTGDIWDYHRKGHWIVITTNGVVKSNGEAVMGKGVALEAKNRWPQLPGDLGQKLLYRDSVNQSRHVPFFFHASRLATFPTKYNWREKACLELIESSAERLSRIHVVQDLDTTEAIYMVRPGCSNGGLDWKDVKPVLEKYLDDRFIIVQRKIL